MEKFTLYNDDCLVALKKLADNSIDSCVTDPPYGLSFMGKSWDYDVPKVEIWKEVYRVLKPGAHLLAFFGSRTYHRGVVAIEDAGFEIRDQIMWIYGTGFPKSHDISKDMDKMTGTRGSGANYKPNMGNAVYGKGMGGGFTTEPYSPVSNFGKQWEGWGTALKPAHEPIVVARKPISQSVARNVLEYGTGAINIDECRVPLQENGEDPRLGGKGSWSTDNMAKNVYGEFEGKDISSSSLGRWPANIITDGSEEVSEHFPTNSSRFFYSAKASKADKDEGLDNFQEKKIVQYQTAGGTSGKASSLSEGRETSYKNTHPTVKPTELMRYLTKLVTQKNGVVLDPFMGSGSTGKACALEGFNFVGIEMDVESFEIAEARIKYQ